ncbi:TPA: hypothetical protein ONA18_004146 [Pseudomonas aeruginosa]|nr:hypothetical protein [Pseudomonas aeruginosa]
MNRLVALSFLSVIGTAWVDPRSAISQAVEALDPIAKPISQALDQASAELTAESKLFEGKARKKLQQGNIEEEKARFQKMRQIRVYIEDVSILARTLPNEPKFKIESRYQRQLLEKLNADQRDDRPRCQET